MSDLSNAEVYNRWKHAKKQTARDYWYNFLLSRADRCDKDARQYTNHIERGLCAM